MKALELAQRYMKIVFEGSDPAELASLFCEDLVFRGPLFSFDTAGDYIESLKSAPPEGFSYEIIRSFESESAACVVYQFSKPGISTPMAQLFETRDGRISRIVLIFDSGVFPR